MCKKIHRGGNAEKYHADKKYKEAVAVAVEACAEDTKGQTCYICIRSSTPPRSDWLEAIEVAEDVVTTSRRVMGTSHPLTTHFQEMLERAKELVRIATSTPADASASPEPVDGPADPAPAKS